MNARDAITWDTINALEAATAPYGWSSTVTAVPLDDVIPGHREALLRLISVASYDAASDA